MLHKMAMITALNYPIQKKRETNPDKFMVSWWGTDSYLNNEKIQIGDIENMTDVYASSGSLRSIERSKYLEHNTYTSRRSNLFS